MTAKHNWTESVSAFAVGVGVGAALGVLFAPRSGSDTRDYLVESATSSWMAQSPPATKSHSARRKALIK